jgi:hypothetical protein
MPFTKAEHDEHNERVSMVKASLSLTRMAKLPRCPAKARNRARKLGPPHTDEKHVCDECRCQKTAGEGTTHYGVGYCKKHERHRPIEEGKRIAYMQAYAIQQGFPDHPYRYMDVGEYSKEIQKRADECKGVQSSREEIIVLRSQIQNVLNAINGEKDMTSKGRFGLEEASDIEKITLLTKLTSALGALTKVELAITDDKYVPVEQVMTWIAAFVRVIEQKVPVELFSEIIEEVKQIPQPKPGRRK